VGLELLRKPITSFGHEDDAQGGQVAALLFHLLLDRDIVQTHRHAERKGCRLTDRLARHEDASGFAHLCRAAPAVVLALPDVVAAVGPSDKDIDAGLRLTGPAVPLPVLSLVVS
jgi:hypothetical protein